MAGHHTCYRSQPHLHAQRSRTTSTLTVPAIGKTCRGTLWQSTSPKQPHQSEYSNPAAMANPQLSVVKEPRSHFLEIGEYRPIFGIVDVLRGCHPNHTTLLRRLENRQGFLNWQKKKQAMLMQRWIPALVSMPHGPIKRPLVG